MKWLWILATAGLVLAGCGGEIEQTEDVAGLTDEVLDDTAGWWWDDPVLDYTCWYYSSRTGRYYRGRSIYKSDAKYYAKQNCYVYGGGYWYCYYDGCDKNYLY
jgi:hypothetical protein